MLHPSILRALFQPPVQMSACSKCLHIEKYVLPRQLLRIEIRQFEVDICH